MSEDISKKVDELLEKFQFVDDCGECGGGGKAKQCALIAVKEIIDAIPINIGSLIYMPLIDYLTEIRIRIENK